MEYRREFVKQELSSENSSIVRKEHERLPTEQRDGILLAVKYFNKSRSKYMSICTGH